jgi:hypothetical protein
MTLRTETKVTLSIKVFIALNKFNNTIECTLVDMSQYGYIPIETYTHTFDYVVPEDFNPIKQEIASLENQILAIEQASKMSQEASLVILQNKLKEAKARLVVGEEIK